MSTGIHHRNTANSTHSSGDNTIGMTSLDPPASEPSRDVESDVMSDYDHRPPMPTEDPPPFPAEHSLPDAEELKVAISFVRGKRNQKFMMVVGACVLALVAIIGLSVGISSARSRSPTGFTAGKGEGGSGTNISQPSAEDRFEHAKEFLSQFSRREDLDRSGSPQNLAVDWIANKDELQVPLPASPAYDDSYRFVQRYVLAVMYYALGGDEWTYDEARFLSKSSECKWNFGLKANDRPPGGTKDDWKMGVACNEEDEVNYIFLPSNNLVGELPFELGLLEAMEHLSIFDNEITGSLPNLSAWRELTFFAAESNNLSGSLGDWIALPKLEYLALGDNGLSGDLPSFSGSPNLKQVALDSNSFTGSVDAFNDCTKLTALFLQHNKFTGPIDDTVFAKLRLHQLDISSNKLTGSFPEHWYKFHVVDLHKNQLDGSLPDITSSSYHIEFLSLYENNFSGSIPDTIGFLSRLVHLDLSYNMFSGKLTTAFNQLVNLEYLFLHRNNFEAGPLPKWHHLTKLKELCMKGTNLKESIPSWIGNSLLDLVLLDLHDNDLEGPIPESMGYLSNLRFLFLNDNKLNETLPDSFSDLQELSMLVIDNNDLTGTDDAVCGENKIQTLTYMPGDCDKIDCTCCSTCCNEPGAVCNLEMSPNLDDTYERTQYIFSENLKFDAVFGEPEG